VLARAHTALLSQDAWTADERASLIGMRWWTLDELESTSELVYPEALRARARALVSRLTHTGPVVPLETIV